MSLTLDPSFGGFDYGSASCDVERWNDEGYVRSAVLPVPRSHIARNRPGYKAPRQITIEGTIGDGTWSARDQLRAAEDAFKWAHREGFRSLFRDTDRYLNAEARTITIGEDVGLLYLPYSVRFECADPYFYATAADATDTWSTPATTNTHAVTNGGSAETLPRLTFTFSSTATLALTLFLDTPSTASDSLQLAGAITNGDVIVIDCAAETVTLNGSNKMSLFTGDFFALQPGSNTLRLVFTGPTIASLKVDKTQRFL